MDEKKMCTEKSWDEFRNAGLLMFINQILHIFGWAIAVELDKETKKIYDVYPCRVRYRGFDNNSVTEAYQKLTNYMKDNIDDLVEEANEE